MVVSRRPDLLAHVPASVVELCGILQAQGYEAYAVGGAVRDLILGGAPTDWDVATSALPIQVQACFDKVLPTGIEHGTVTVLLGDHLPIEVTTFRGDGDYSDGRRPESVSLGVPLREDLARRDFTVNAMALDVVSGEVIDPFDGLADLDQKLIKAVGAAEKRFAEDGLRVLRGLRFASTLGFALETETEHAIRGAIETMLKVAWERIRVELEKLLAGAGRQQALAIGQKTGVWQGLFPSSRQVGAEQWRVLQKVDSWPTRLAVFLYVLLGEQEGVADQASKLRLSKRVLGFVRRTFELLPQVKQVTGEVSARQLLAELRESDAADFVQVVNAIAELEETWTSGAQFLSTQWCLRPPLWLSDLVLTGRDIQAAFPEVKGRLLGDALGHLRQCVLQEPSRNQRDQLKAELRTWLSRRA